MGRTSPKQIIKRRLKSLGIDNKTIEYWTAVSAFETAYWKSKVFVDSNNAFSLIVPGTKKLQYGEGQTIYNSIADSVDDLYYRVIVSRKYPKNFDSLTELVTTMKAKGYFQSDGVKYLSGVQTTYFKIYGKRA